MVEYCGVCLNKNPGADLKDVKMKTAYFRPTRTTWKPIGFYCPRCGNFKKN